MSAKSIYMDNCASTPVRQEVLEAMLPYWSEHYGNPAAVHSYGRNASRGLEQARRTIAEILGADPDEIAFTGCGSESDNLAIRGAMWAARSERRGNHMITSAIEHKAVLETARQLEQINDFEVTVLPVDSFGRIDLNQLESAIRLDTALISIMTASNEIGTLQPITEIGELAREHGVLFHTDAIQGATLLDWDLGATAVDMLSLSAHKFYGPKGVGVMYARKGTKLIPTLTGGDQEAGLRSGTVSVPLAVGAAEALLLATQERDTVSRQYQELRDRLIEGVLADGTSERVLTGHPTDRLPNHASFAFKNLSGNDLLMHLDMAGVAASSGSACLSGDPRPSTSLEAIGLDSDWTKGGLRLSVGRNNTMDDVDFVVTILPQIVASLNRLSLQFV